MCVLLFCRLYYGVLHVNTISTGIPERRLLSTPAGSMRESTGGNKSKCERSGNCLAFPWSYEVHWKCLTFAGNCLQQKQVGYLLLCSVATMVGFV